MKKLSPFELAMFNCVCGKSFVGYQKDFDQHLKTDCKVFALAKKILVKEL